MRCGRLKQLKKRFIAISRNCLYYFKSGVGLLDEKTEEEKAEYGLAVGVIPLFQCAVRKQEGKTGIEILHADQSPIRYIRLFSEGRMVKKEKSLFYFEFCRVYEMEWWIALEEEAVYFREMVLMHDAETNPYEAIMQYDVEFNIFCQSELNLVECEGMRILNEIKANL